MNPWRTLGLGIALLLPFTLVLSCSQGGPATAAGHPQGGAGTVGATYLARFVEKPPKYGTSISAKDVTSIAIAPPVVFVSV